MTRRPTVGERVPRYCLVVACAAAVMARLYVMYVTAGSNDIHTWQTFAKSIRDIGLVPTYRTNAEFNHPPLMGLWCFVAGKISHFDSHGFQFAFKLLPLAGDLLAAFLLWQERRRSASENAALALAAAFLWNPISFIITAYHGNTDPLLAALCLWSVLLAARGRSLGAGLALGAAFNVKIVPLLLIVPLACSVRSWRDLFKAAAGFTVCLLPFLYPLLEARQELIDHVFKYNSAPGMWGLNTFFSQVVEIHNFGAMFAGASAKFKIEGRYLILGVIALVTVLSRLILGRRVDRTPELAAFALCTALVLGQGFGFQYLAWPIPILFLLDARRAFLTSAIGGGFLAVLYAHFWDGRMPAFSNCSTWPPLGVSLGLLVWVSLLGWCCRAGAAAFTRRRRFVLTSSSGGVRARRAHVRRGE